MARPRKSLDVRGGRKPSAKRRAGTSILKDSTGIIVLGAHRSGTSLVASLLARLGCGLGGELVPASEDNKKGHWEHRGVVEAHDEFLRQIGRTWSDPAPIPREAFESSAADNARDKIRQIVDSDFSSLHRWVLKDPRMSRLLPLWGPLLTLPGLSLRFLHVIRSPVAVVRSLEARDGLSAEKSLLLWLRHVLEGEVFTRNSDRLWVALEGLETETTPQVERIARWVDPSLAGSDRTRDKPLASVLERELIHHHVDEPATFRYLEDYPWVADAYRGVVGLAHRETDASLETLDRVRHEMTQADRLMFGNPWASPLVRKDDQLSHISEQILYFTKVIAAQRAEIDALRGEVNHKHSELLSRSLAIISELESSLVKKHEQWDNERRTSSQALEELNRELRGSREHLRSVEKRAATLDAQAQALEKELHESREYAQSLEQVVSALRAEIASLSNMHRDVKERLDSVVRSRSWQLTRPFRELRERWRRPTTPTPE